MSSLGVLLLSVKKPKQINWRESKGRAQYLGAGGQDTQCEAEGAEFLQSEDEQAKGTRHVFNSVKHGYGDN